MNICFILHNIVQIVMLDVVMLTIKYFKIPFLPSSIVLICLCSPKYALPKVKIVFRSFAVFREDTRFQADCKKLTPYTNINNFTTIIILWLFGKKCPNKAYWFSYRFGFAQKPPVKIFLDF